MSDPLFPHLLDILADPASEGLILAGGYGIRLKQAHLQTIGVETVLSTYPEARATQDLDFFLRLELFTRAERGAAVRALLERLGYHEHTPRWQFGKAYGPARTVKVDLLARLPGPDDNVAADARRVGKGSGTNLHGRTTPEAFAVEDTAAVIPVWGNRSDGSPVAATASVPHPYSSLTMKVRAAHDWLGARRSGAEERVGGEKHALDVYLLTAMLTEAELAEARDLAARYARHPLVPLIRQCADELFGSDTAPGFIEVRRQAGRDAELNFPTFRDALRAVLSGGG